jgi:drug/metabolite transporter (DMT)-like permease
VSTKRANNSWLPAFIILGITWGASFLFIKWGLVTLTSVGVAFMRGFIGAVTLIIYCLVTRTPLPNKLVHWGHLAVVALFLNAGPGFLFAYAETHVSSVMAGLMNAATPLMTVLVVSVGFREQKINMNQGIGVVIGFAGIVLVTGALSGLSGGDWKGIIALLCATVGYGISMPYAKRHVAVLNYPGPSLAAAQVTCSVLMLAPIALTVGITHSAWTGKSFSGMLILGAFGTGFAYIWNYKVVRAAGSVVASTVTFITPVVATILGIWLLNESFKITQLIGGALVLLSAALVQKRITFFKSTRIS